MLTKYGQFNQASFKKNILIFVRIQQNTCSSKIEIINFNSQQHWEKEFKYIKDILEPLNNDFILISNDPACLNREFLDSTIHIKDFNLNLLSNIHTKNIICFLNKNNNHSFYYLNKILNQALSINIYVIRNEGDFLIQGINIECDCNNCLASSILKTFKLLEFDKLSNFTKFDNFSSFEYQNGYQYSILNYNNLNHQNKENLALNKRFCKKEQCKQLSINYPYLNKNLVANPYEKYKKIGSPKYIAAPMVGQSELAFRMMVRKYGAQLCYTPMIDAEIFVNNLEYQHELFTTVAYDRPLIAQFAANDPNILLTAAKKIADQCDFIDINLGCPQAVARRHNYGAWLMEDPYTIYKLINTLTSNLKIPVSCKIRIFESIENTIKYAKMLENAGCSLLTIHGRERKSNMNLEPANWEHIKEVKKHLNIPVIVNGSINNLTTAQECLEFTGCDGVMAASHLLENPCLFSGKTISPKKIALEYLDFAQEYNSLLRYAKAHVLQIFSKKVNQDILNKIKLSASIEKLREYVLNLPETCLNKADNLTKNTFDLVFEAY